MKEPAPIPRLKRFFPRFSESGKKIGSAGLWLTADSHWEIIRVESNAWTIKPSVYQIQDKPDPLAAATAAHQFLLANGLKETFPRRRDAANALALALGEA